VWHAANKSIRQLPDFQFFLEIIFENRSGYPFSAFFRKDLALEQRGAREIIDLFGQIVFSIV